MFGIVNLNKPAGWSSRDAVNRVKWLVRPDKSGHAGTLDPLATGVLVVCIGQATRLIDYVQRMPKEYVAAFLLGRTSPSDDVETPATPIADATRPTRGEIEAALPKFTGDVQQIPPAYSAAKIEGRRAYKLARRGDAVEIAPRMVTIHRLQVVRYDYPRLELRMNCSSGTYVRSLGRDLAESLGTGAVMAELVRTAVGSFHVDDAVDPEALNERLLSERLESPLAALADLSTVTLTADELAELQFARPFPLERIPEPRPAEVAALDAAGNLQAILRPMGDRLWRPSPNFSQPE